MEAGLEKLSVLIPLAGNEQVQLLIREQLRQWNDSKLDSTIDHSIFSVYQTLAGLNVSSYAEKDQFHKFHGGQDKRLLYNQCCYLKTAKFLAPILFITESPSIY